MVLVHVFDVEVGDDVGGFGGGEQRDAGSVAEEAEVAVVGYDVDGGVPGDACGGGGTGAGVVDGGDIAAVESDAWATAEERAVGGVDGWDEEGGAVSGGGGADHGLFEVGTEDVSAFSVVAKWFSVELARPGVVHSCETVFVA